VGSRLFIDPWALSSPPARCTELSDARTGLARSHEVGLFYLL
jgi:hypothetical protein